MCACIFDAEEVSQLLGGPKVEQLQNLHAGVTRIMCDSPASRVQLPDKVPKKKTKKKGTFADSLAVLRSSPKTMNLALLVVSYGVSHRLFEFAWKGQLRALYPSAQEYQVCTITKFDLCSQSRKQGKAACMPTLLCTCSNACL